MKNLFSKKTRLFFTAFALLFYTNSNAQQKTKFNVAIFLYPGVELLDFAGPGEVFASSPGFKVYTVSVDGNEILSQSFVTVKPQYSIANAPETDIVVLPGGATSNINNNSELLAWVNKIIGNGGNAMSVCTGAGILAKAGLLKDLNVTTHHGFLETLQQMSPTSKVLEQTRFVDNGNIITTAGVSAGIDGALHLVARLNGTDVADATAWYMEYQKWDHSDGKIVYQNPYLESIQSQTAGKSGGNTSSVLGSAVPYVGELKDASQKLLESGNYEQAESLLEKAIKWYPDESAFYILLTDVYTKLGKPAPVNEKTFLQLITDGKVDEAIAVYDKTQKEFPGWKLFSEGTVNRMGYTFLQKKDYNNAIKIFGLNVKAYPQSGNVYDSLGEALLDAGNKKDAILNYQKSLEIDPSNDNARKVLKTLQ